MSLSQVDVLFNDPEDCQAVFDLMDGGMRFNQAIDFLELRPFTHFSVTRADCGPDGHD